MSTVNSILIALFPSLIVAVISSILTVNLSIRKFRSEKWWEKKDETYSNIVENLSYLLYYFGEWIDFELGERHLSDERKKTLNTRYVEANECLIKASASGAYIISENASAALTELLRELNNQIDFGLDDSENKYRAIEKCIETIKKAAKDDLNK